MFSGVVYPGRKKRERPGPTVVMHLSIADKLCSVVLCVSGSKEKEKTSGHVLF